MSKAFGTEFTIVRDVIQLLDLKVFRGGPWIHLATVTRGLKEYMAFKHLKGSQVYVEEVDPTTPGLLKKIADENEWQDIVSFLTAARLLEVGNRREIKFKPPEH